jgi:hypothetical protein
MLIDKLDRMLNRRHQLQRAKRHHLHPTTLDVSLPEPV